MLKNVILGLFGGVNYVECSDMTSRSSVTGNIKTFVCLSIIISCCDAWNVSVHGVRRSMGQEY